MAISKQYSEFISQIKQKLRVEESFDLIYRTIQIAGRSACLFFIDGMVKDEVMEKIMEFFYSASEESLADAHAFSKQSIPYVEVDLSLIHI